MTWFLPRPWAVLGALLLTASAVAGCSADPDSTGSPSGPASSASSQQTGSTSTDPVTGKITVLAAASLTESFTTIGRDFEKQHPHTTVTFSFGASSTLATQIDNGAPADVFASADEDTMSSVTKSGAAAGKPAIFATNTLEIAVPPGNPAHITGLADFADPDHKTALCAPEVPCGAAAQKVFAAAGIVPKPVTYEQDVKATLLKVEQNEVDAALVYKTDVAAAGDKVEGVDFDESSSVVNKYPIVALKDAKNPSGASAFVAYVRAPSGQRVLADAGFGS